MKEKLQATSYEPQAGEITCPECGSSNIFDLEHKFECDECGHTWRSEKQEPVAGVIIPGEIRTFTGVMFNVFNPKPEDVCIEDIAHALSNQCRFSGHTSRFYSVAEHSIRCAEMIDNEYALSALLHDASEAYLVDIPSPLKIAMPKYIEHEAVVMRVIADKFGFEWPLHHMVKRTDKAMLEMEWKNLMLTDNWITMSAEYASSRFLKLFDKITSK